ncbi:hypothetical protein MCOR25_001506 [Pyricularia grisea]|uniref:Uncharacterized protein n=1 Tax=Pyricularia grisea TaxID=148305 RepID=A0A6P8AW14_PYRGI|nr:uncharacterized protein PgNI_09044 [Pyricularia grisea]KAI6380836.1 hypothetical protein MCOR25_001506 [Pyricularia grisea]TLD06387.1 hypothetical protein PgNI_09044 [Pyricularia grisea]
MSEATRGSQSVAQDDLESPAPTAASKATRRAGRRLKTAPIQPEPGSLYDIMHTHSGTGLYVLPILWTDLHTKSLNVQFQDQGRVNYPAPVVNDDLPPSPPPEPCDAARNLCYEISTFADKTSTPSAKMRALKRFMSGFFPGMPCKAKTGVEMELHFGTRFYRKAVKLPMIWKRGDSRSHSFDSAATRPMSSSPMSNLSDASLSDDEEASGSKIQRRCERSAPLLAYVDRDHLSYVRKSLFRVSPGPLDGDYQNSPVLSLQQLRSKALVPADRDQDAHLVAIFIAMAQQRFYNKKNGRRRFKLSTNEPTSSGSTDQSSHPSDEAIYDVEVRVFTFDAVENDFIVYTGTIGADFLEGFADPARTLHRQPYGASSMRIAYTRVPIWPFYGLKERLGKALGSEVTGARFVGPGYDTYRSDEELASHQAELARAQIDSERILLANEAVLRREKEQSLQELLERSFGQQGTKRNWDAPDTGVPTDITPPASAPKRRRGRRTSGIVEGAGPYDFIAAPSSDFMSDDEPSDDERV